MRHRTEYNYAVDLLHRYFDVVSERLSDANC